jgi:hypothetical protein
VVNQLTHAPVTNLNYYPIQKRWQKIKPHLQDSEVQRILVNDMNKFTFGRWRLPFEPGMLPCHFESCDWRSSKRRRGPEPHFWHYVKHSACHWLVNFNLALVQRVEYRSSWRIITSDRHSTVWNGEDTLFDLNFSALGISVEECFLLATFKGVVLPPGKMLQVHEARHYILDDKTLQFS